MKQIYISCILLFLFACTKGESNQDNNTTMNTDTNENDVTQLISQDEIYHTTKIDIKEVFFDMAKFFDDDGLDTDSKTLKEYPFSNLFDNDEKTAFVLRKYDDKLFTIELVFNKYIEVSKILIYNGYGKSEDLYYKNLRIDDIEVLLYNFISNKKPLHGVI